MDREERQARKREKMIANAKRDRARKAAGKPSGAVTFAKTFLIAFCIFFVVATPIFGLVNRVADINPFGGEDGDKQPVLAEELDVLVSEDSPFFEAFTDTDRANILLMGVNGGLTDTIMLCSLDRANKRMDIISIPRDTYYHRNGYNGEAENKINAAYRKDPVNTARAVSDILMGMPINYYAVIDYEGVKNVVNAMGGVPMVIEFNMRYKDPYDKPPLVINLPKGEYTLDGDQAVQFLRYRHGYAEGDIGRVKAQQRFVKSALKQCLSLDLPKIVKTGFANVKSDITIGTALGLATASIGMDSSNINTYMMPNTPDPNPPYYVYPKGQEIADMITQIYSLPAATTGGGVTAGAVN